MRVLVACERSGIVRDAFTALGDNAVSCDLEPSDRPGPHYQGDVRDILANDWDLMIAHPPCTYLTVSGARWFADRQAQQDEALAFVRTLLAARIQKIAIENPVGVISTRLRKPDQIIHPWMFGHGETKGTCLWLVGLPRLRPTGYVDGRSPRIHHMPPGPERSRLRSQTYPGIAAAMARQWGSSTPGENMIQLGIDAYLATLAAQEDR
jgi:hypothetical protein